MDSDVREEERVSDKQTDRGHQAKLQNNGDGVLYRVPYCNAPKAFGGTTRQILGSFSPLLALDTNCWGGSLVSLWA